MDGIIKTLRESIDATDLLLLAAIRRRLQLVKMIGARKREMGIAAVDAEREQVILGKVKDVRERTAYAAVIAECRAVVLEEALP
jgi:chorismate mutase